MSSLESFRVSASGESRARCRISSEYALPIPLKSCGSVSARLSVWFPRHESGLKLASRCREDLQAAGIVLAQGIFSLHDMERRPVLGAGFREPERTR